MKHRILISFALLLLVSCGEKQTKTATTDGNEQIAQDMTDTKTQPPVADSPQVEYKVRITTSLGDIVVKLYNETPKHRDNFLKLVREGYYDGLLFHRVIQNFMIQGGDPDSKNAKPGQQLGQGGPGYTIPAEFRTNLIHKKGALAAARLSDNMNPSKASSGSQFYIVQGKKYTAEELNQFENNNRIILSDEQKKTYREVGGTPSLDYDYTVFGEVVSGMDVLDKIAAVKTNPQTNRPIEDVEMKMKIEE